MATETLDVTSMLANQFEPLMTNRFILMIEGIDAYLLKSANVPSQTTEEVEIGWMNTTRYVAGKTKFDEMEIVLYQAIAPAAAQQVMEWVRLCYESVSGRAGYADFYKRDVQLKLLDPVGTVIQLWDIKGAWLKSVKFGELKYESQEPVEIQCTLRYDNAVLQF